MSANPPTIEATGVPPGVPANLVTPQGNMPAIGVPNSQDYARLIYAAPYFTTVPIAEIIQPSVTEAVENALPSLVPPYVDQAVLAGVQQYAVLLTGSTMTGPLNLSPLMPTADSQAATKAYVDAMLATAGIPEVPPVPSGQIWARETGQWVPISQSEGTFLPLAGGTMGGSINMSGNTITNMAAVPAMPNGAAPAQWVLNQIASVSLYQGTWDADTNTPDLTQLSTHVNAYTWIALTTSPSGVVIGAAIPGLQGLTVFNGDTIIYSTVQGAFTAIHAGGITLPEADGRYVQLAGSQMSGALLLNSNATQNMQAVPFQQLEAAVANTVTPDAPADGQAYLRVGVGTNRWVPGLPLAGGILTGALTLAGNATAALNPVPLQQMTSAITAGTAGLLPIAGGTMTGPIVLAANATTNLNPVPLQQLNSMLGAYLPLTGGTVTGLLNLSATPPSTGSGVGSGVLNLTGTGGDSVSITAAGQIYSQNSLSTAGILSVGGTATLSAVQATSLNLTGPTYPLTIPNGGAEIAGTVLLNANLQINGGGTALSVPGGGASIAGTIEAGGQVQAGSTISSTITGLTNAFVNGTAGGTAVFYAASGGMSAYGFNDLSDASLKRDITSLPSCLDLVLAITPHTWHWENPDVDPEDHVHWGFVAQEVASALGDAGHDFGGVGQTTDGKATLAYSELLAIVWKAVQELAARIGPSS